ncbi:putative toxin-antitoxin system toxin component, PIN family [Rhizobium sp. RU36D]|uniref:putative toxin-antitoxin system toxin component, PIN family n=1 Tax=Rhizobium sp. RU36D TaxID=1907415 RepID=UPI0009D8D42A|nr:putative toxin-antitoxin system toxin component, PIN family [Rhizobium sp. RU36D]SMC81791.1 putative toxin-antitoxin system toxin component, PIN family [Rhizobium sp. RU36D]
MIRIVADTNVVVSACIGRGPASKVIEACLDGRCKPYLSGPLLMEYRDVFSRDAPFKNARLSLAERWDLLEAFVARCEWGIAHFTWRPNLRDEADNHLIELAIAVNAHILVTSNTRDFAHAELRFPHLKIELPEETAKRLLR